MYEEHIICFSDRSHALFLLTALSENDKSGYQIIRELEARSDSSFFMKEGSVYLFLHRLEVSGDICSYETMSGENRMRRYYKLTRQGAKTIKRIERKCAEYQQYPDKALGGETYVRK